MLYKDIFDSIVLVENKIVFIGGLFVLCLCQKNSFLVVLFLCVSSPCFVYGMDEFNEDLVVFRDVELYPFAKSVSFLNRLSAEPQKCVGHHLFCGESIGVIAKYVNDLRLVNKQNSDLMSHPQYRRQLTKELGFSDEEFVKATRTLKAEKIMAMQNKLFDHCKPSICITLGRYVELDQEHRLSPSGQDDSVCVFASQGKDLNTCVQVHEIEELLNQGADLEFTYDRNDYPKHATPFMALCLTKSRAENDMGLRQIMKFFVDMHKEGIVDIDRVNPGGTTGFMESWKKTATHWVGQYFFRNSRRSLQHLDAQQDDIRLIDINHQDNAGNTALFNYYSSETNGMDDALDNFITAGANPEIVNNDGLTALGKLEQDNDSQMKYAYNSLKAAIENKKNQ